MIRTLAGAGALALALISCSALAQPIGPNGYPMVPGPAGAYVAPVPVLRSGAAYTETTVSVTGGSWTQVASAVAANQYRQKVILADATGLGCVWSTSSSPSAGQGFPFSLAGTAGAWVIDDPVVLNAIYVKCSTSGTITVGAS